jgi:hypothetical protein
MSGCEELRLVEVVDRLRTRGGTDAGVIRDAPVTCAAAKGRRTIDNDRCQFCCGRAGVMGMKARVTADPAGTLRRCDG